CVNVSQDLALRSTYSIVGFAQDTHARQNQNKFCFCTRLIRSLAAPKILSLGKIKINFAFALDLFVSLH
ncbi:hypothetical protein, partial [uncultured Muribaculum sp.]|uniref:hypothetical protein n=1 Tax=uncultured Muribaculum sp. TaxID=1918613 RepID=UPI0026104ABE